MGKFIDIKMCEAYKSTYDDITLKMIKEKKVGITFLQRYYSYSYPSAKIFIDCLN